MSRRRAKPAKASRRQRRRATYREAHPAWNRVRCLHCQKLFRAVVAVHLVRRHGYRGRHPVLAYKRRFGLEQAWSTATRQAIADGIAGNHGHRGRAWSRRRVLIEVRRRLRSGASLASTAVEPTLTAAGRRYLGTWAQAVEAVRVRYDAVRKTRVWSRQRIIAEIHAMQRRGEPLHEGYAKRQHGALYKAAIRRYPSSWGRALKAAGIDAQAVQAPHTEWTMRKAAAWVRRVARIPERSLGVSQVPVGLRRFLERQHVEWSAFVISLGERAPGPSHRHWSKAAVVREIRRRHAAGKSLRVRPLMREDQSLYVRGRAFYGSWETALRAAGKLRAMREEPGRRG